MRETDMIAFFTNAFWGYGLIDGYDAPLTTGY